jgi:class 3 adenylate cyclase
MMAVDMVDFTQILQEIGAESVYALLQHVLTRARNSVEAHGGYVIDTAGDGLLAAFGAPRALENASLQACKAAWTFHQDIAAELPALAKRFGTTPQFRTGIAGGNVMVVQVSAYEVKVVGDSVNLAARLQANAAPDQILLSEDIRRETDGFLQTRDQGQAVIKGYADPVVHHSLVAIAALRSRFEGAQRGGGGTAFVSRKTELDQVIADLDALSGPNIVAIIGAPGIGKSRLLYEVLANLPTDRPVYVGQCAPTGQAGFGPIYDIIRQASPAPPDASFAAVLNDLHVAHPQICDASMITSVAAPADEKTDMLTRALQERDALLAILRGLYRLKAAVFVIEDVHWIDSATHDLIDLLKDDPVPMIITCRPTMQPVWIGDLDRTTLTLGPLSHPDIKMIVQAGFTQPLSPALADEIATKAEGNPLIAEEIARALHEGDALSTGPDGLELKDGNHTVLTGNLQQLVLSRVDSLPDAQKAILQVAAAIGRDFSTDVLMAATGQIDIDSVLAGMLGLIERHDQGQWRFAHALIRDAVYAGLLSGQRAEIHYKIAVALEGIGENSSDSTSLLAYHFTHANVPTKAVPYLTKSAQIQLSVYAVEEADQSLEQAMQLIEADPQIISDDALGSMAATWFRILDISTKHARSKSVADRILPRLEALEYTSDLGKARTLSAMALTHLRDYPTAHSRCHQTLRDAQVAGDALGVAWAKVTLMRIYEETYWEPIETVERLAAEVAPVAAATGDRHLAMTSLYLLSSIYRSSGSRIRALNVANQIADAAKTQNDRRARAFAQWSRALIFTVEGNPEATFASVTVSKRDAIPGTADHFASVCIELFAISFLHPVDDVRAKLHPLRAKVWDLGDYNLIHSLDWIEAVLAFKNGNLALGWRLINLLIEDVNDKGNINLIRQAYILRSEILLTIAGLIDPDAEAPPDRPVFAKDKPGLADVMLFLRLKLTAKRRATADLKHYIAIHPVQAGAHYARAQIGLGLIAMARNDRQTAENLLRKGYEIAVAEGLLLLQARAEDGLKRLGITDLHG